MKGFLLLGGQEEAEHVCTTKTVILDRRMMRTVGRAKVLDNVKEDAIQNTCGGMSVCLFVCFPLEERSTFLKEARSQVLI